MSRISKRVSEVPAQQIREMFELSKQLDRDDIIHLEFGEADFETPDHVVDAANHAASSGETKYTSNAGIESLREAIADHIERQAGRDIDPNAEVVVTTGAVEALFLAIKTVADPNEKIVIPTPVWPNVITQSMLNGCRAEQVPLDTAGGYYTDIDAVVDEIEEDTAAVVLVSPSNPTGQVYEPDAVQKIAAAAAEHECYLIADEVYRELMYVDPPPPIANIAEDPNWVLSVDSTSKSHAMTGWRVGWLSGPADVVGAVVKIRENTTSCVNTPAQYAAISALQHGEADVERMRAELATRRDFVISTLDTIDGLTPISPLGGFYVFVKLEKENRSSVDFAKGLLRSEGVVVAPGSAFGTAGEDHIRISFGSDLPELRQGLDRLASYVDA